MSWSINASGRPDAVKDIVEKQKIDGNDQQWSRAKEWILAELASLAELPAMHGVHVYGSGHHSGDSGRSSSYNFDVKITITQLAPFTP